MPWQGDMSWQHALEELVVAWMTRLGTIERIPPGWEAARARHPHEAEGTLVADASCTYTLARLATQSA